MSSTEIIGIQARQILDSRGNPTVEADVILDGSSGRAAVPSGASTGEEEALELRDGDETYYLGRGVKTAIRNIHEFIKPAMLGMDASDQRALDNKLLDLEDDKRKKDKMGANAILAVSMAASRAAANAQGVPLFKYLNPDANILPVPMMNIMNGGEHAMNNIDIQEFMVVPVCGGCFAEALRAGVEVYQHLKKIVVKNNLGAGLGDEGGFAPNLKKNVDALKLIHDAIAAAGYEAGREIFLAIDCAANSFYDRGKKKYVLEGEGIEVGYEQLIEQYYEPWIEDYHIISIEDPFDETDWEGFSEITRRLNDKVQIVGDDIFVTQEKLLKKGFAHKAANSILIKLNQVGTVSETLDTIALARKEGYSQIVSHRSGETEDTYISDFAVAIGCGQIKTGAPARGERTAKYNRLLRIEEMLAEKARFPGMEIYSKYERY